MRTLILLVLIAITPIFATAQDNLKLTCPLDHSLGREPKEAYAWDPKDLKVIMVSKVDTSVRSCVDGIVSNVAKSEDGNYEIVIYYKNYYFWYVGVSNPVVKKNQAVTARQIIGSYRPGTELEFRMFKDEATMDPRNMLECQILKSN
jgi:hypothetical protein